MKSIWQSQMVVVGLAIFSMLFGAGNLIYPVAIGAQAGQLYNIATLGFIITAVMLPLMGLVSIIFFDGSYEDFFARLGKWPSKLIILSCMIIIGPLIAIPRIVTVSYTMLQPFLNGLPISAFALIFLGITFLCTFRENKIVELLGKYISPALVLSLMSLIVSGFFKKSILINVDSDPAKIFFSSLRTGYETLDLLGTIFFSSIIISLLKKTFSDRYENHPRRLAAFGLKSGILGTSILAAIYYGISSLAAHHAADLKHLNGGEIFRTLSYNISGELGGLLLAIAVLMACFSTSIALGAVVGEYVQHTIFKNKVSFVLSLSLVLISSLPLSIKGLDYVAKLTGGPITYIGYPILITLTFCNLAYKLWGFRYVKLPVAIIAGLTSSLYLFN